MSTVTDNIISFSVNSEELVFLESNKPVNFIMLPILKVMGIILYLMSSNKQK